MEIIVNISALKEDNEGVSINAVKSDLVEFGAIVRGAKDVDGDTLMLINGDITVEDVENAFINIGVNVNDYIVEEDDLTITQTFEKKNVTVKKNQTAVNEKKGSCCPPKKANGEKKVKKEYKGDLVNLSEALHGTHKRGVKPELKLNQIIDAIAGCHIDESISARAIEKAKQNNKRAYLQEKLGAEVYNAVLESLENGTTVHANKKINGKAVCEYSIDELKGLMEKASKQIEALEKKLGLNEADDAELTKKIARFKDAVKMIDEEISFREAQELLSEGDGIEFKNINPNVSDDDKKKEKKDEEATVEGDGSDEVSDEDDAESTDDTESEDDADDKEQNPDEDEEVELASIIITLATKDDAEDLKADFIEAGIPEDAIELEEVADDDEEDDTEGESEGESTEETDTENASEETKGDKATEESVQFKGVKPLNEDDDNAEDAETAEDDSTEETTEDDETKDDEESEDEEAEKAWKVILVNTDYAKEAKDVLVDMWGMTEEEFNDMIGGDIVDDEDNAEDDGSDESSDNDDDSTKSDDENGESEDDDDDFDPNDIFANF